MVSSGGLSGGVTARFSDTFLMPLPRSDAGPGFRFSPHQIQDRPQPVGTLCHRQMINEVHPAPQSRRTAVRCTGDAGR